MANQIKAKILLLDIETAPNKVYTWGLYDQTVGINQIIQSGYVLCWAAKWLGSPDIMCDALIDHPVTYKKDSSNDKELAKSMWKLLDGADIVVTHNGDVFDIKWLNTLFITHRLPPPSPFMSIDTCKSAKRYFRFVSNKLGYLNRHLNLSNKLDHDGFGLWVRVMAGDRKSWSHMVKYCKQDVKALEELYLTIKPYIGNHPDLALFQDTKEALCPKCTSVHIKKKGFAYTAKRKYQRLICLDCGTNFRGKMSTQR